MASVFLGVAWRHSLEALLPGVPIAQASRPLDIPSLEGSLERERGVAQGEKSFLRPSADGLHQPWSPPSLRTKRLRKEREDFEALESARGTAWASLSPLRASLGCGLAKT